MTDTLKRCLAPTCLTADLFPTCYLACSPLSCFEPSSRCREREGLLGMTHLPTSPYKRPIYPLPAYLIHSPLSRSEQPSGCRQREGLLSMTRLIDEDVREVAGLKAVGVKLRREGWQ